MAVTRETTGTSATVRSAARAIVLAGDRTLSRVSARRHSIFVRSLKFGLPLSGIVISALYGLTILRTTGFGKNIAALEMPTILPENLAMQNPHYEGFNADGGQYWVKAESAQQVLKSLNVINLTRITGELTDAKKLKTTLTATRGTFDSKANVLELYDAIDIGGDAGMKARLTRATIDTKQNIITSSEPVNVAMEAGSISANQMTVRQKAKEYTFVDDVKTHLNAREKSDTDSGAEDVGAETVADSRDAGFGKSDAPVDITSNRLDVNDATKTALFSGGVVAVQEGSSLTSPELEVTYEGSATSPGAAEGSGSKVKRIVAINPVTLKQANGDTITSQNADFDPVAQKAILEGDVVMAQLPDKRATADRAEVNQAENSVLLTGEVVVTQGQNVLKGRRLLFNRASSRMQLTAPAATDAAGRISARFQQNKGGAAAAPSKDEAQKPAGMAFGASFKTDPNAPVNIEANRLDVDDSVKQAVFSGDVRAVQGDFVIRAAELKATYAGSAGLTGAAAEGAKTAAAQLTHIKASSKVEITSKDGQKATGDWADFDTKANMATLGGNVVLIQGSSVVRGSKLLIDMTTGESTIPSDASPTANGGAAVSADGTATAATSATSSGNSRPSAVFYPGELKAKAGRAAGKVEDGWQTRAQP